jgi:hypothetical protein
MSHGSRRIVGILATAMLVPAAPSAQQITDEIGSGTLTVGDVPHAPGTEVDIDGVLDDAIWRDALVIEIDIETNPRENSPAPVQTFVYIIEDGARLLIAFDARDPAPDQIRAYLGDRDSVYNDDFVGVVLDTFNDQRRAFEFFVNPLGVQMDMTLDDVNGGEDDSWDAIWESAGTITDQGFVVEMAIPFSQLRFQRTTGPQVWGIDTLRFYPRTDRVRMSAHPQDRGRNCYLCQMDKIRGFASAEPGRGLEVVPSLTASRTDLRDATLGRLVAGSTDSDVGVDVRWAVTPDLIANLAVNPDFSQVEADVPQLDVNNQFALFFPETRPFFLEGANFFGTPIDAVFTRTVADPDVGAKITGTSGTNTFGLFAAEDTVTNLLFPGALGSSSDSLDQSNRAFVGRYQRGFGTNSAVGALLTSRSGDGYHNRVGGFDGNYRPTDQHSFSFQYLSSDTEYPDAVVTGSQQPAGTFTGDALQLNYDFGTREWNAFANYRRFDPDFRADSGFVSQVDVENQSIGFNRIWHGDGTRWWNQLRIGANTGSRHRTGGTGGQLLGRWRELFFSVQGPLQWFGQAGVTRQQQFWNGVLYDQDNVWAFSQFRPRGGLNVGMSVNMGDQIDFANSRLGDQLRLEPWVNWNANRHLLITLQHTAARLDDQAGERIFEADLTDLRFTWQFNVRSFLRFTTQQQSIERNLAQFINPDTDAHTESRGAQLLYSYQLNPQTVVYAGYSDNHMDDDDLASLTKTDRTFFLKFSYAWVP